MRGRRLSEAIYPVADEAGLPNPDSVARDLAKFMMSTVDGRMTGLRLSMMRRVLEMLRTGIMAVIDSLAANCEPRVTRPRPAGRGLKPGRSTVPGGWWLRGARQGGQAAGCVLTAARRRSTDRRTPSIGGRARASCSMLRVPG